MVHSIFIMLLKWLLILALVQATQQKCAVGCLRCNSTDHCLFCDTPSNYYMTNGTCVNATRVGCELSNQKGECLFCGDGYYIDPITKGCLPILTDKKQPNCLYYTSSMGCHVCKKGFFVVDGKCVAVTKTIDNCWIYQSLTECQFCDKGYMTNPFNTTQCVAKPTSFQNCIGFNFLTCRQCRDDLVLVSKGRNIWSIGGDNADQIVASMSSDFIHQAFFGQAQSSKVCFGKYYGCSPTENELCMGCTEGEYLDKKQCKKNPDPRIDYCQVYSDLITCTKCMNGYFLDTNSCKPVVAIVNCNLYNGSASSTVCIECKDGFFVSENACVARTKTSIKNCIAYDPAADQCLTCDVGTMITTQKLGCLFSIDYCVTYADTAADATIHNCSACRNGYYVYTVNGQKVCVKGTVPFCLTYDQNNVNKCLVCLNGNYLSQDVCKPHVNIDSCKTYDQLVPHQCQTCDNGFMRVFLPSLCVKGKAIDNCESHSEDLLLCWQCKQRFYVTQNNKVCEPIPLSLGNCLVSNSDGSSCIICADGQILFKYPTYQTCLSPPDFMTAFGTSDPQWKSDPYDPTSTNLAVIHGICTDFSYPIRLKSNEGICVKNSQLKFITSFNTIPNCRRYAWSVDISSLFCSECNDGYYIIDYSDSIGLSNSLRCSDTCDLSTNIIILNDLMGIYNLCIARSSINWTTVGFSSSSCNVAIRDRVTLTGTVWYPYSISKTLECLSYDESTTVPVWDAFAASSYAFDVDLVNNGNAYRTDFQYLGYHFSDRKPKPFAFNYAGYLTLPAFKSTVFIPALTSNCNLYFEMKSGSAYAASGRDTNLIVMSTAKKDLVCLQCQFGYVPRFTEKINSLWVYAPKCNPTVGDVCNKSIVLGGLPNYLNAILSCHSCVNNYIPRVKFEMLWSTPFQIPVTPYSTAQNKGFFLQYTFNTLTDPFQCHNPASTVLLFNIANPATTTTNTNCGVYGDISRVADVETTAVETKTFCLACKHGYAPFYFRQDGSANSAVSLPNFIVQSCNSILNCDLTSLNKPFNSCGKCIPQQVIPVSANPFYAFADLLMRKCDASKTNFCFVLKPAGIDCMICQSGYYLNKEGYCDAIIIPNMQEGATFNSPLDIDSLRSELFVPLLVLEQTSNPLYASTLSKALQSETTYIRIQHLVSFTNLPTGPSLCRPDYSIVSSPRNLKSVCVWSPLLKSQSLTTTSYFIQNCQKYKYLNNVMDITLLCSKCSGSFIPTDSSLMCVDPISNCEIASTSNTSQCQKCNKGYANLNGVCSFPKIDNCASYLPKETKDSAVKVRCEECVDEYYWDSGIEQCVRNPSLNCLKFQLGAGPKCVVCVKGSALVSVDNWSVQACIPVKGMFENCDESYFDQDGAIGGAFLTCAHCTTNDAGFFGFLPYASLPNSNNPTNVCVRFNSIENCIAHDISNTGLSATTYNCLECSSGFYAQGSSCLKRNVMFEGCAEYHKTQDTCIRCVPGLIFVASYFPQCVQNPKGVPRCSKYSDEVTCVKCQDGYYLSNNLCLLPTPQSDCLQYSANYTCSLCRTDYFVNATGFCVKTNATNCLTIASISDCATCPNGKGLKKENSTEGILTTNCVDIVIENCAVSTKEFPFKCLICNKNYSVSNDTCALVDPLINNCLVYESATLCNQCDPGYSLSVDKKKCETGDWFSLADSDCSKVETLSNPVCSQCQPGYSMVNGACQPALKENSFCIGFHPLDPTICLLCQPKTSWMNSKGFCVQIVPETILVPVPVASVEILRRTILMMFLLVLMNWK